MQNRNALILPQTIYEEIVSHARTGKPEEVCGLLRGRQGTVTDIRRSLNVASNKIMDYEVDPAALLVQFDWEEEGDELIALYHSHPVSPAYPSASDAYKAYYPDSVYLICSLQDDDNPIVNGFYLREIPGAIDMDAARTELPFIETRAGRWGAYVPAEMPSPLCFRDLERPPGLAVYIVFQVSESEKPHVRKVSVEQVAIEIVQHAQDLHGLGGNNSGSQII